MNRIPIEIYDIIMEYLPIISKCKLGEVNKLLNEKYKRIINIPIEERKKLLMEETRDGIGYGGEKISVAHGNDNNFWKLEFYESPWEYRWWLKYVWWFDISVKISLKAGKYEISGILWNVYETLYGEVIIDDERIINKKYECPGVYDFPKYYKNMKKYLQDKKEMGIIEDITENSNSERPCSISLYKKYRYKIGIIEIDEEKEIIIRLSNTNCEYHKDNIIIECFRVKRLD